MMAGLARKRAAGIRVRKPQSAAQKLALAAAQRVSAQKRKAKGRKTKKKRTRKPIGAAGASASKAFGRKK